MGSDERLNYIKSRIESLKHKYESLEVDLDDIGVYCLMQYIPKVGAIYLEDLCGEDDVDRGSLISLLNEENVAYCF
ncbi:hypothetical protein [Clostridium sp.]|uniref:hypothetical protein n=1 Tax=Clostridium sp. TaxID=1506 RepID=UPI0032173801